MKTVNVDLSQFHAGFFEEVDEHCATLEASLLQIGEAGDRWELLNRIFRAAHSIKGASGTFGFDGLVRFTHVLEELLDRLRGGGLEVSAPLVGLLLRSVDVLRGLAASARHGGAAPEQLEEVRAALAAAYAGAGDVAPPSAGGRGAFGPAGAAGDGGGAPEGPSGGGGAAPAGGAPAAADGEASVYFAPGPDTLRFGMDPLLLVRNLTEMGRVTSIAVDASGLPAFDELDPEVSYLAWSVRLETAHGPDELREVFAFVEDTARVDVEGPPARADVEGPPSRAAGEAAAAVGGDLAGEAAAGRGGAGPAPSAAGAAEAAEGAGGASVRAPATVGRAPAAREAARGAATLRVAAEKLDRIIDLVGELVIAQSMVNSALADGGPEGPRRLREAIAEVERNTRELQDRVMSVRMVPVGTVFSRFSRVVHDIAALLGKEIRLEMSGEDTEIDRGMVELLADPLTHLVRNAADHGLEAPGEREAAGKPRQGALRLRAAHQGGSVVIDVSDDGRGLRTEAILKRALALGLVGPGERPSTERLHAIIFEPGFSTAERVTDVSGRGVGMDVVKRNVEAMGGSLTFTSEPGRGSLVRLRLPLTMAIMDGLSLRVGRQTFVVPIVSIVESFRPVREQLNVFLGGAELVRVRGEAVPLVRLHRALGIAPDQVDPTRGIVCVVEAGAQRVGLLVDELLGQAQVVVKSLEANFQKVDGVMGATILGDGRVALILDVPGLVKRAGPAGRERETRHGLGTHA
jgi:two-component system chemotaxis sensor kinase CheA